MAHAGARTEVAGHISHPDRILFRAARTTKLDLARYYESIAKWVLTPASIAAFDTRAARRAGLQS